MKTRHHRKAKSAKGKGNNQNISLVEENKHRAWHLLFNHGDPQYVVEQINSIWLDPAYQLVLERRRTK